VKTVSIFFKGNLFYVTKAFVIDIFANQLQKNYLLGGNEVAHGILQALISYDLMILFMLVVGCLVKYLILD
jgi:hypothetical protein